MKQPLRLEGMGGMALSSPPGDFSRRKLTLARTPKQVVRLAKIQYPDPIFWSKKGIYRFDSATAPYGVLYTARNLKGAIFEVWGDRWFGTRYLGKEEVMEVNCYTISIQPSAKVANCTGNNLSLLGTDSSLFATLDYRTSQEWGRALMNHPTKPEGLAYHARKNPNLTNFALFGRSETEEKVHVIESIALIEHPDLFDILDELQVDLI
jgi:RES domain-containing protein